MVTITTVYPGPRGGAIFSGRDAAGKSPALCGRLPPYFPGSGYGRDLVADR